MDQYQPQGSYMKRTTAFTSGDDNFGKGTKEEINNANFTQPDPIKEDPPKDDVTREVDQNQNNADDVITQANKENNQDAQKIEGEIDEENTGFLAWLRKKGLIGRRTESDARIEQNSKNNE